MEGNMRSRKKYLCFLLVGAILIETIYGEELRGALGDVINAVVNTSMKISNNVDPKTTSSMLEVIADNSMEVTTSSMLNVTALYNQIEDGYSIDDVITLEEDMMIDGNTYLYGQVDLNGYKMTINGNLYCQEDSILEMNGGQLYVKQNIEIQDSTLIMNNANDEIHIEGDFKSNVAQSINPVSQMETSVASYGMQSLELTDGCIYIKGNLSSNSAQGYYSEGNHRTIFNGIGNQYIDIEGLELFNNDSSINSIEIVEESSIIVKNYINLEQKPNDETLSKISPVEKVLIQGMPLVNEIEGDVVLNNYSNLNGDITIKGNLYINGYIELNGYKLVVKGSLYCDNYATLRILGGSVQVQEDVYCENSSQINLGGGRLEVLRNMIISNSILSMSDDADEVVIKGNLTSTISGYYYPLLTNGKLYIGGDLTANTPKAYYSGYKHITIFNGEREQYVDIKGNQVLGASYSISELAIEEGTTLILKDYINLDNNFDDEMLKRIEQPQFLLINGVPISGKIEQDATVTTSLYLYQDLAINGNLYIQANVDLNGHKLEVSGSVYIINNNTIVVDGGKFSVEENLKMSSNSLIMNSEADEVIIKKDLLVTGYYNYSSSPLTKGKLYIGGNLTSDAYIPYCSQGQHITIFNGIGEQCIDIKGYAKFNNNYRINQIAVGEESTLVLKDYMNLGNEPNDQLLKRISPLEFLLVNGIPNTGLVDEDLTIRTPLVLHKDMVVDKDLYIKSNLDLNGHTLTVLGNVYHTSGTLKINKGNLIVGKDFKTNGLIYMKNVEDSIEVQGNYIVNTGGYSISSDYQFTAGMVKIKGNLKTGNNYGYKATGEHRTIFYGEGIHIIDLYYRYYQGIGKLGTMDNAIIKLERGTTIGEIINVEVLEGMQNLSYLYLTSIHISEPVDKSSTINLPNSTVKLTHDLVIKKDLTLTGTLDLNGYNLIVEGDFYHKGYLNINKGKLTVHGNLQTSNSATFYMQNDEDIIEIKGNYLAGSGQYNSVMTKGKVYIGGNLEVIVSYGYKAAGTHETIFNGSSEQSIRFYYPYVPYNNIGTLVITDDSSVTLINEIYVDALKDKTTLKRIKNRTNLKVAGATIFEEEYVEDYTITNSIKVGSDVIFKKDLYIKNDVDLNGQQLIVEGDLYIQSGSLTISNGKLEVRGNCEITGTGRFNMLNEQDEVRVLGDFNTQSTNTTASTLTSGKFYLAGNLISNTRTGFFASQTHTLIMNGNKQQVIMFASTASDGNAIASISIPDNTTVRLVNPVVFQKPIAKADLDKITPVQNIISEGNVGNLEGVWEGDLTLANNQLTSDLIVTQNLYIKGDVDLRGYQLTVKGHIYHEAGTLTLNGGQIKAEKNYYFAVVNGENYTDSTGKIVANQESEQIEIIGDLVWTYNMTHVIMSSGKLILHSNVICKYSNYSSNSLGKFTNEAYIVLAGNTYQEINLYYRTELPNLEVTAAAEKNIKFYTEIIVTNRFVHHNVNYTGNVYFKDEAAYQILSDPTWDKEVPLYGHTFKQDIKTDKVVRMVSDTYIDGVTVEFDNIVKGDYIYIRNQGNAIFRNLVENYRITIDKESLVELYGCAKINSITGEGKVVIGNDVELGSYSIGQLVIEKGNLTCLEQNNNSYVKELQVNSATKIAGLLYIDSLKLSENIHITNPENIVFRVLDEYNKHPNKGYSLGNVILASNYNFTGDVRIKGNLSLSNNAKVNVAGDLLVEYGSITVYSGNLYIAENLNTKNSGVDIRTGTVEVGKDCELAWLSFSSAANQLICHGNLKLLPINDIYIGYGQIIIEGDLVQQGDKSIQVGASILFKGNKKQQVILNDNRNYFTQVTNQNTSSEGVIFNSFNCIKELKDEYGTIHFEQPGKRLWLTNSTLAEDLVIEGDVYLVGTNLDLNGHTVIIKGNLTQIYGNLNIGSGTLKVDGDYKYIHHSKWGDEAWQLQASYSTTYLNMENADGYFYIKGNMEVNNNRAYVYLRKGKLVVLKDCKFAPYRIDSDINHKLLLIGDNRQTIDTKGVSYSYYNKVGTLVIDKAVDNYTFNPTNCYQKLEIVEQQSGDTPQGFQISYQTGKKVVLKWNELQPLREEESYRIYRNGELLEETTERNYNDTTVQPGETYTYQVTAVVGDQESEKTGGVEVTPSEPKILESTVDHEPVITNNTHKITVKYDNNYYSFKELRVYDVFNGQENSLFSTSSPSTTTQKQITFDNTWYLSSTAVGEHTLKFVFTDIDGNKFIEERKVQVQKGAYAASVIKSEAGIQVSWKVPKPESVSHCKIEVYEANKRIKEDELQKNFTILYDDLDTSTNYTYKIYTYYTGGNQSEPLITNFDASSMLPRGGSVIDASTEFIINSNAGASYFDLAYYNVDLKQWLPISYAYEVKEGDKAFSKHYAYLLNVPFGYETLKIRMITKGDNGATLQEDFVYTVENNTVDLINPEITNISPEKNKTVTGKTDFKVVATDNHKVARLQMSYWNEGQKQWTLMGENTNSNELLVSYQIPTDVGSFKVRYQVWDKAGNTTDAIYIYEVDQSYFAITDMQFEGSKVTLEWTTYGTNQIGHYCMAYKNLTTEDFAYSEKIAGSLNKYTLNDLVIGDIYEVQIHKYDLQGKMITSTEKIMIKVGSDNLGITSFGPHQGYFSDKVLVNIGARSTQGISKITLEASYDQKEWQVAAIKEYTIPSRANSYAIEIDLSSYKEGELYFRPLIEDQKGNILDSKSLPIILVNVDRTAPPSVKAFTAEAKGNNVNLSWELPDDVADIAYWQVERRAENESEYRLIYKGNGLSKGAIDTTVQAKAKYTYRIFSVDWAGNGSSVQTAKVEVLEDRQVPTIETSWDGVETPLYSDVLRIHAIDDFYLANVLIEIKTATSQTYKVFKEHQLKDVNSAWIEDSFSKDDFEEGNNTIRITATDQAGNKSEEHLFTVKVDKTPPKAPNIVAQSTDKGIALEFSSEEEGVRYYLFKKEKVNFNYLIETTETTYLDQATIPQKSYTYMIYAEDTNGNRSEEVQLAVKDERTDNEAPSIHLANFTQGVIGRNYILDASKSMDNCGINEVIWLIDDEITRKGAIVNYSFNTLGIHNVKVVVTDYAGNKAQREIEVEVVRATQLGGIELSIVDNKTKQAVTDASVYITSNLRAEQDNLFYTNANGVLTTNLPSDTYEVSVFSPTAGGGSTTLEVKNGEVQIEEITLEKIDIIKGQVNVKPLSLEEIVEAGIDIKDPDNRQVYEAIINLEFEQVRIFVNQKPQVHYQTQKNGYYYYVGSTGGSGKSNDFKQATPPTLYILKIPFEISMLKEFFEIELELINTSDQDICFQDIMATIDLPNGLSLAPTTEVQTINHEVEEINGGQQTTTSWLIRGDKEGEYEVGIDVSGVYTFGSDPNKKIPDKMRFITKPPLKVYGNSALYMYVEAPEIALPGEEYTIDVELTNVSDKDINDLKIKAKEPSSYKQVGEEIVVDYGSEGFDFTTENMTVVPTLKLGQEVSVKVLEPGQSVNMTYTTKILFPEKDEEGFDVQYMLRNAFITGMNGRVNIKTGLISTTKQSGSRLRDASYLEAYNSGGIDAVTGAQALDQPIMSVNSAIPLSLGLEYNTAQTKGNILGRGWSHTFDSYIEKISDTQIRVFWRPQQFTLYELREDGVYVAGDWQTNKDKLYVEADDSYRLERSDMQVHYYNAKGKLTKLVNKMGQALVLAYNDQDLLETITEPISGENIHLAYDNQKLSKVTDDHGRSVKLSYNQSGLLESVTDVLGQATTYHYNKKKLLEEAINAEGNSFVKLGYNAKGKVISQTFPKGYTETYSYETYTEGNTSYITMVTTDDVGNKTYKTVDMDGQLLKEIDELGNTYYFTYDSNHRKIGATDGEGNTTRYQYNDYGDVTEIKDAMGYTQTYTYDEHRNLLTYTNQKGKVTTYTYDESNNTPKTAVLSTGATTRYDYNAQGLLEQTTNFDYYEGLDVVSINSYEQGRLKSVSDFNRNETTTTYDTYGFPRTVTDREGNTTTYIYDAAGQLKSMTDAKGYTTTYTYDKTGLLKTQTDVKGTISYDYDTEGNMVKQTDPKGNVTEYDYTIKGQLKWTKYADGSKEQITYNAAGQIETSTDRNNAVSSYTYDKAGNLETETHPQSGTTSYTYDSLNRKKTETNAKGANITYEYDELGQVVKIIAPDRYVTTQTYDDLGNLTTLINGCMETTSATYDKWGTKLTSTDARGYVTSYKFDKMGNLKAVTSPLGQTTSYYYDKENRLRTTTNSLGYTTSMTYDALGNIETTTDGAGRTMKTFYDARGNAKEVYDGYGQLISKMTYDAASNLETVTDALGNTTTNHYDNMNRLQTSIDALNQTKERQYDNRGNLKQVVDPATENRTEPVITSATYNPKGQVKTITDPEGNTQSYDYDIIGNLLTETTPFGGKYSYTYNDLNLLKTKTNARGQTATYDYDATGRIKSLTDQVDSTSYTYDKNGNLLTVSSAKAGTITRTFDELNRVKTYTDANGNTIQYSYDAAGNLKELTYPNGQTITYNYDGSGLLTDTIDFTGGTTHYDYDNNGRIKTIIRPNGTTRSTTYDATGQVKTIIDTNVKGEIICNYSFDYDDGGKIKEEKGLNENLTITNGETFMTYGKGNRLLTYNGEEVKYDADGNMTYGPLDGKMVEFKYDARNRLIEAGTTTYQYDAENNRIGQITNGEKTTYVVDTTSSALSRVLVEKKGNTVRQYIYATGLIMHVEGGEYATYHYDNRGSTVAITNGQGTVTDTFTYGPYGEQCGRTGKTRTPFLYNGRYGIETDNNGLYYMRARYYNPDIKRFINQDVIQGSLDNAITLNRFAYANGNPISLIDPFGLAAIPDFNYRPKDAQDAARYTAELEAYAKEKEKNRIKQMIERYNDAGYSKQYMGIMPPSSDVKEIREQQFTINTINNAVTVVNKSSVLYVNTAIKTSPSNASRIMYFANDFFMPALPGQTTEAASIANKALKSSISTKGMNALTGSNTFGEGAKKLKIIQKVGKVADVAGTLGTVATPFLELQTSKNMYMDELELIAQNDPENFNKTALLGGTIMTLDACSYGFARSFANTVPSLVQLIPGKDPQWTNDWIDTVNSTVNAKYVGSFLFN